MAKRIVVLGVSTFSEFLLRLLAESGGVETVAVDKDEERINAVTPFVNQPIIGSVRNHELLQKIGVDKADHVIVSLGDLEDSLVCVLYLKQLEARHIMAKALNEEHVEILRLLKVDEIVFPERSIADITVLQLLHPETVDTMKLSSGHRIVELAVPDRLAQREMRRQTIKEKFGLELIMIVRPGAETTFDVPESYTVRQGDRLVLVGSDEQIAHFENEVL